MFLFVFSFFRRNENLRETTSYPADSASTGKFGNKIDVEFSTN